MVKLTEKKWVRPLVWALTLVAANVGVGYYITDKLWAAVEVAYMDGHAQAVEGIEEQMAMVQIASYQEGYRHALERIKASCINKGADIKATEEGFWFKCGPLAAK